MNNGLNRWPLDWQYFQTVTTTAHTFASYIWIMNFLNCLNIMSSQLLPLKKRAVFISQLGRLIIILWSFFDFFWFFRCIQRRHFAFWRLGYFANRTNKEAWERKQRKCQVLCSTGTRNHRNPSNLKILASMTFLSFRDRCLLCDNCNY